MYNKNEARYFTLIRFAAFGISIFLWSLSVLWSAEGFGIKLQGWKYAGYGLALSVTVVQLIFNRGTLNPTLFFGGIAAYIYGIATNIIGLFEVMEISIGLEVIKDDPLDAIFTVLLIITLAFVVEVLPESLVLYSINPSQGKPGDFISSLFQGSGLTRKPKNRREIRPDLSDLGEISSKFDGIELPKRTNEQNRTNYEQNNNRTNKTFPYPINWGKLDRNTNIYKVLMFYREFWNKTGKECPNKTVEAGTRVSKGQVSDILAKLKRKEFA